MAKRTAYGTQARGDEDAGLAFTPEPKQCVRCGQRRPEAWYELRGQEGWVCRPCLTASGEYVPRGS